MRRRLDLAAGLIGRPPVILLDEPTTGLNPRSRQELWSIVEELRRERTTVLLTTQYLEEADRLAQQIAVVDRGRIAAQGTAAQLKAMIGGNVLRVRLANASDLPGASAALAGLAAIRREWTRRRRDPPRGGRRVRIGGGGPAPGRQADADHRRRAATAQPRRRVPHPHQTQRG